MKTSLLYKEIINQCTQLAEQNLSGNALEQLQNKAHLLINDIDTDQYVKIPFIGDFSAGKSTLINAFIDRMELLPTNITPETAVAYELYYAPTEYVELRRNGKIISTKGIDQIKTLEAQPGDVVYVYLDNQKIKSLIDREIVIVDMPGIDSGIETHNNAILNYINFGTVFVIVNDIEQGSLRSSTISFVREISKYQLDSFFIISKADKKPQEEIGKIKSYISEQISKTIGNKSVGVVSAATNDISDLEAIMSSLNADIIIEQKYKERVVLIISEIASSLNIFLDSLSGVDIDTDNAIKELKQKHENKILELQNKKNQAQSPDSSANDIINDIRDGLLAKEYEFASMIVNNQNDHNILNSEILSTVRPVIMESLRREGQEYSDNFGGVLESFVLDIQDVFANNTNLSVGDQIAGQLTDVLNQQKDSIVSGLQLALNAIGTKYASLRAIGSLVRLGGFVLGPIIGLLLNVLPDILKYLFGGSEEKKLERARTQFTTVVIPKVLSELRKPIISCVVEQQNSIFKEIEALINDEIAKIEQAIQQMREAQHMKQNEIDSKREQLDYALVELNAIKNRLN